ncbi:MULTISPECIES: hypothetical protein [unclassified Micromonospora]|uniref:hypothetical protein n=1 Tax=unclassified Micromonospora TaxID=2617518 RepID=UPI002FEF835F
MFMTPPLATVGLTEREPLAAGHRVKIASRPVAEIIGMPRAHAVEETRGFMKFVIDAETDQILGAALLSIDAQELINTVALAIRPGTTAADLRDAIYSHPSSTEAFNDLLATTVPAGERLPAGASRSTGRCRSIPNPGRRRRRALSAGGTTGGRCRRPARTTCWC